MHFSQFGEKFMRPAGVTQMMSDLEDGIYSADTVMLGGGNPASIPEIEAYIAQQLATLQQQGELRELVCNYSPPPRGEDFATTLCRLFNQLYDWDLTPDNIALTNGSQCAFFYLFNLFAGHDAHGRQRKVLFPLNPEYIGYTDAGLEDGQFISTHPHIQMQDDGFFKYHIDFERLPLDDNTGLICVSRPTNPTGNVITDSELERLSELAQQHDIPLLIDNAYGQPFPDLLYSSASLPWNSHTILCMSLSKIGLPGTRCGLVIAAPEIIRAIRNLNSIISLSVNALGPLLLQEMIQRNDLLDLCQSIIRPYYQNKINKAVHLLRRHLSASLCQVHRPEGAFFLWLWFPKLTISTDELYQRLKARKVIVVPGSFFELGLDAPWPHLRQCIRITVIPDAATLDRGLKIIADEVIRASA